MSDHFHKHHHHDKGAPVGSEPPYGEGYVQPGGPPTAEYPPQSASSTTTATLVDSTVDAEKRAAIEKAQKRNEHLAEIGSLASGAFAMYEQHKIKVDPEHAQRHRIEQAAAGAAALGAGGFAVYEHHQISTIHKADEAANPDKHGDKHKHHK